MEIVSVRFLSPTNQVFNYSTNVPLDYRLRIEFDSDVDPTTVTSANIFLEEVKGSFIPTGPDVVGVWEPDLTEAGGFSTTPLPNRISGAFTVSGVYATFAPDVVLRAGKQYRLHVGEAVSALETHTVTPGTVTGTGVAPVVTGKHSHNATHTIDLIITTAGTAGTAKFRWEVDATSYEGANLTVQTYAQELSNWDSDPTTGEPGILVAWGTGTYAEGDEWNVEIVSADQLSASYTFNFTTISEAALNLVPGDELPVIEPPTPGERIIGAYSSVLTNLVLESISPEAYSVNDTDTLTEIVLTFSQNVDPTDIEDFIDIVGTPILGDTSVTAENDSVVDSIAVVDNVVTITLDATKLFDNNILELSISKDLASTGLTPVEDTLGNDATYYFFTSLSPFYCTVDMLKLEIGGLISNLEDRTLTLLIYYWSRYLNNTIQGSRPNRFTFLAERFVLCAVTASLVSGNYISYPTGQSKSLGDLKIAYNVSPGQVNPTELLNRAQECKSTILNYLSSGNTLIATPVKSDTNIDNVLVGRLWIPLNDYPMAQNDYLAGGSRRLRKAF